MCNTETALQKAYFARKQWNRINRIISRNQGGDQANRAPNRFVSPFKLHLQTRQFSRSLKSMTVTLDMPKEIEAQFTAAAQARGVPLSDYVRDFIVEHYQEIADDVRTAQERLADPQTGITSNQLRKKLGLDS